MTGIWTKPEFKVFDKFNKFSVATQMFTFSSVLLGIIKCSGHLWVLCKCLLIV